MMIEVVVRTQAASTNTHVAAVQAVLSRHEIKFIGQYRGASHYAVYATEDMPDAVLAEVKAVPLPTGSWLTVYDTQERLETLRQAHKGAR
jgi:hypothetical protein